MSPLDRPTFLDIADRCIPEVCRSHFNMWCHVCRFDTSNNRVIHYLAAQENVAK